MNSEWVKKTIRRFGFDVSRRRPNISDFILLYGITLVLDVGANEGQYASLLKQWGYRGKIVSFEPVKEAFDRLNIARNGDSRWESVNVALGSLDGETTINVSHSSVFSSLLKSLPRLQNEFAAAEVVGSQKVQLRRLDSILQDHCSKGDIVFLKIDTQGYEREVLKGAEASLARISGVQLEVSLDPLYAEEATFGEILGLMDSYGFTPALLEPVGYDTRIPAVYQMDTLFVRKELIRSIRESSSPA